MQVFIIDRDSGVETSNPLTFSLSQDEKDYVANLNLLDPFDTGESSETAFGYSLSLKQLDVSYSDSSPEDFTVTDSESNTIFYYDHPEGEASLNIYLKIEKNIYEQIDDSRRYEVFWKKFFDKPSVKYIYQEDQENYFVYCAERKKKIDFDSTITFTKKMQTLVLTSLNSEDNSFNMGLRSDLEVIGFKNEKLSGEVFQIIPLGSSMFFDDEDEDNYTFSLLVEEKEEFPLDFFIKNIEDEGDNPPPSEDEGDNPPPSEDEGDNPPPSEDEDE